MIWLKPDDDGIVSHDAIFYIHDVSFHSTLMSSIFWLYVTKYRHNIDFWQRSTERYPHFYDFLGDRSWLKFCNIPVLRVRMCASSLSLLGALFSGLVIFYSQNEYFWRSLGHQKKNLFVSAQGFLPAPASNSTAGESVTTKRQQFFFVRPCFPRNL